MRIFKIILAVFIIVLFTVPILMLFGGGAPAVFLMFFAVFFVISPLLQLLVPAGRELPRSTVSSAAMGLAELAGVARRRDNKDGSLDPNNVILSFF